jgi:phage-related protein
VAEPKPLYLRTTSKYIYAVPEGDFKMTELRYDCYECEIQFVCHNPEYYSASVKASTNRASSTYGMRNVYNNNTIEVYNGGNASAYPIIDIGINDTASFVQVENTTNGNKFLLGSYPKGGSSIKPQSEVVFSDNMSNYNDWLVSQFSYENRDHLGSPRNTNDGSGIMINIPATGSSLWHGIGSSRNIGTSVTDFEVRAKMHFNSYGVDGDPTVPQYRDGATDTNNIEYFYKVVAPSVPIRATQEANGTIVGSYNKGDKVFPLSPYITNGWLEVEGGYCEAVCFQKCIADSSITYEAMNVVVTAEEIELWSRPSDDPSDNLLLATIPGGTVLRVYNALDNDRYYKLYIPYNGKVGYIDESMVTAYDAPIEYPEEDIIVSDDNKTGICEVYGYSSNNTRLFKLCLSDENQYYSFITPTVYVGDNKALEDITTVSSSSKANIDDNNVAYDALSESTCDWNNFYGELGIRRVDNKWQAWIYKIENGVTVKKLMLKEQEISGASSEPLQYIAIYIGTQDPGSMCAMSITDIQVEQINEANTAPFKSGDEIKIDCYNNKVYLNNKLYNNIDMGSQFIELVTGNNVLKFTSDDSNMHATVLFNERYL